MKPKTGYISLRRLMREETVWFLFLWTGIWIMVFDHPRQVVTV